MKRLNIIFVLYIITFVVKGQNSPFFIWGGGLDGSINQKTGIYSDITYGLLIEAPKTASNQKLPIEFNWRGGGPTPFKIMPNGKVGMGVSNPHDHATLHVKSPTPSPWGVSVEASSNQRIIGISHNGSSGVIAVSYLNGEGFSPLQFHTENLPRITIDTDGEVGIGTTTPDSKLTVKGIIHAEEVKLDLTVPGPDYVFEESYALLSLQETNAYIEENKHLPGIPSSDEMQQNGVNLLEMNMKLLEKVEELTLHLIEMKRENEEQQKQLNLLLGKSGQ